MHQSPQTRPRGPGSDFHCSLCGASFGRAEHLSRHRRSHTNTKPFTCPVCSKGFTRRDTLSRHIPIHSAARSGGRPGRDRAIGRVSQACDSCARLRLRCDGQATCARCQSTGAKCIYSARLRRRVPIIHDATFPASSTTASPAAELSAGGSTAAVAGDESALSLAIPTALDHQQPDRPSLEQNASPIWQLPSLSVVDSALIQAPNVEAQTNSPGMSPGRSNSADTSIIQQQQQQQQQPLPDEQQKEQQDSDSANGLARVQSRNILSSNELSTGDDMQPAPAGQTYTMPGPSISTDDISHHDLQLYDGFGVDLTWDPDFSFVDWMTFDSEPNDIYTSLVGQPPTGSDLIDSSCDHSMPNYPDVQQHHSSRRRSEPEPSFPGNNSRTFTSASSTTQGSSSNAYQWPTDWNPGGSDNLLSFPDMSSVSIDVVEAENFAHVRPLTLQSYKEMRQCLRRTDINQIHYRPFQNANLPPIHVMDCFLQLYFEYFHPIFPMLHQATFEPCTAPWQLSLGICAIGCRYSKLSSSSQCANALQELLRRAIAGTIEKDNSIVRELWVVQIMILNSIGMMYSGNRRFFEVAEAVRNSPAIQCRRNGSLKPTVNPVSIHGNSSGRSLEMIWRQWIYEESRRRAGFSSFLMDSQAVLYLDSNPCLAVSELQQQLPCSESLWDASEAEIWKEQYLKHTNIPGCTVELAVEQLRQKKPSPPTIGDFARLVLVFVIYMEVAAVNKTRNSLLLADRRIADRQVEEGIKGAVCILETLKLEARSDNDLPLRSSLNCHIHLTLMLLFAPRNEVINHAQSFKTELEAVGARQRLREWIDRDAGRHARHAIAAAGALSGLLQSNSTLGFYEPIAALLATLIVWTYSQILEDSSDSYTFNDTGPDRTIGNGRTSVAKLDNFREVSKIREWIDGVEGVRAHIKNIGNLCRPSAGSRILDNGRGLVAGRSAWLLSDGFDVWLGNLKSRADKRDYRVGED